MAQALNIFFIIRYIYIVLLKAMNLLNHHQCASIHLDDATAAILCQNAHHTSAVIATEANQCMGMIRGPLWSEANGEIWPFLMTTESQVQV